MQMYYESLFIYLFIYLFICLFRYCLLKEAIIYFGQNKMEDCLAACRDVCARATRHNSGNWPFLTAKAFYIISAVYRQAKEFEQAKEYMEKSSEVFHYLYTPMPPSFTGKTLIIIVKMQFFHELQPYVNSHRQRRKQLRFTN